MYSEKSPRLVENQTDGKNEVLLHIIAVAAIVLSIILYFRGKPNAVSTAEDSGWSYDILQEFRDAVMEAEDNNLGTCTKHI